MAEKYCGINVIFKNIYYQRLILICFVLWLQVEVINIFMHISVSICVYNKLGEYLGTQMLDYMVSLYLVLHETVMQSNYIILHYH